MCFTVKSKPIITVPQFKKMARNLADAETDNNFLVTVGLRRYFPGSSRSTKSHDNYKSIVISVRVFFTERSHKKTSTARTRLSCHVMAWTAG